MDLAPLMSPAALVGAAEKDPENLLVAVEAADVGAYDWSGLLIGILRDSWATIRDAVDALVADQRPMIRLAWAIAKKAVEAWLAEDAGAEQV